MASGENERLKKASQEIKTNLQMQWGRQGTMRKQPYPTLESLSCGCSGRKRPSLEHNITCPCFAEFILGYRGPDWFYSWYGENVTPPSRNSNVSAEMMQCDCGHWFPRWECNKCPKCKKEHETE